jgi:hypothetical protein
MWPILQWTMAMGNGALAFRPFSFHGALRLDEAGRTFGLRQPAGGKEYSLNLKIHLNRAQRLTPAIIIRALRKKMGSGEACFFGLFQFLDECAGSKPWPGVRPDVGNEMCCPTFRANEITAAK